MIKQYSSLHHSHAPSLPSPYNSAALVLLKSLSYYFMLAVHFTTFSHCRCIEYCINNHHSGHLPVKADVIPLSLSLSTTQLTLTEPYLANKTAGECGIFTQCIDIAYLSLSLSLSSPLSLFPLYFPLPNLGLRGSVIITNKHGVAVLFQWHAREEVDTETFYMMHPSGMHSFHMMH